MNNRLEHWNALSAADAEREIVVCCGSRTWARRIASRRPIAGEAALLAASDEASLELSEEDWLEAFRGHPRIGESHSQKPVAVRSAGWSAREQSAVAAAADAVRMALAEANREYEARFGHIFIVCATGKSAPEILAILHRRLKNDARSELREAAEQQRRITQIRLKNWLEG